MRRRESRSRICRISTFVVARCLAWPQRCRLGSRQSRCSQAWVALGSTYTPCGPSPTTCLPSLHRSQFDLCRTPRQLPRTTLHGVHVRLRSVQVIYRHGARTPLHVFPGDHDAGDWATSISVLPGNTVPLAITHMDGSGRPHSAADLIQQSTKLPGGSGIGLMMSPCRRCFFSDYVTSNNRPADGKGVSRVSGAWQDAEEEVH